MRRLWILLLCWAWACAGVGAAQAQDQWRPVSRADTAVTPASARSVRPKIRLGAPQTTHSNSEVSETTTTGTEFSLEQLGVFQREPTIQRTYFRGQSPGCASGPGFGPGPMSPEEQYNCGVISEGPPSGHPWLSPFRSCWDRLFGGSPNCGPGMGGGGGLFNFTFQSDHAFDDFVSPITNPFFFEDPRSLTEARLIVEYQKSPANNPLMRGGNTFLYTLQGRLAFNEYLSIVVHRLGFATVRPGTPFRSTADVDDFAGGTGFSDLQIGPKWTFYRNPQSQTIAAIGANFEIPVGSEKVLSHNGAAVTPYLSVGQGLGNFHLLGTTGYRFGISGDRSDHLFASLHADYKIGTPLGAFYPLVELNYYYYTKNGNRLQTQTITQGPNQFTVPGNYEGAGAFNLGADDIKGRSILTLGAGLRYKLTENLQAGAVYEFPIVGKQNGLQNYRIGVDLIFRY